jgi:hypothetical protein
MHGEPLFRWRVRTALLSAGNTREQLDRRSRDLWFKTFSHGDGGPILDVSTASVALCL